METSIDMATRKQLLWFGASTAIIVALVLLADINKFIEAVSRADKSYLVAALVIGMLPFFVWTNTWYSFLNKMGAEVSYLQTFKLFMAGNFMNSVTPLGQFGGEPLMAYVIRKNTDLSYEEGFSAVLSSDIINSIPIFTFILSGSAFLLLFGSINDVIAQAVYIAIVVVALGGSLAYTLWFKAGTIENAILQALRKVTDVLGVGKNHVKTVDSKLDNVQEAFNRIGEDPRHLIRTATVAHAYFVFQVFTLYLILASMGIESDFTPLYFILPMASLSNFSPTPGGSGAYEATLATILTVMPLSLFPEVTFATALAVGILFRLCTYWPGLIIGYFSLLGIGGVE